MLRDCLTGTERSGDSSDTALCDREESIDYALTGDERLDRRKFFLVRTSAADRPLLHHGELFVAVFRLNDIDNFVDSK